MLDYNTFTSYPDIFLALPLRGAEEVHHRIRTQSGMSKITMFKAETGVSVIPFGNAASECRATPGRGEAATLDKLNNRVMPSGKHSIHLQAFHGNYWQRLPEIACQQYHQAAKDVVISPKILQCEVKCFK
ncbi:hypothetical protein EVAR_66627_1 [Eumeta japonica]|uniref:Uncharacterized protein n=1 Tax=Eumeta variegata TaxID=151549 RepID=A0A4C1ZU67_EUMVA|nr:hypothetical protein EVAR_66627_1 [Eumeta japonica]